MKMTHEVWCLTIGTEVNGKGEPLAPRVRALAIENVLEQTAAAFGGFTRSMASGCWTDDNGDLVREATLVIRVFVERKFTQHAKDCQYGIYATIAEAVVAWANLCREILGQQSVCLDGPDGGIFIDGEYPRND